MIYHLFLFYRSIIDLDIEQKFENMRKAWDPQQPVETLFKQIQYCVDFTETGGVTIGAAQKLSSAYYKIFKSGKFNSACRRWDEKIEADKTWNNFKIHFSAAYRQHRQMQGDTVGAQIYANAAVAQPEDDLEEQALGAFANLATATAVDRGVVAQLTEANSRLAKKMEDNATALRKSSHCSKKSERNVLTVVTLNGHIAVISRLLMITIAGLTVTKYHVPPQAKLACTQRMDTSVKSTIQTTCEDHKSTGIDFWGQHLKIMAKHLMIAVPHPCLRTIKQPL
jgi:hypothetical protein